MDEYLWPARNVAEYAYCPRLFYLMEVEGLHLVNGDTERGQAVHRRVDAPSAESDVDAPKIARSLTLTSRNLNLTATLDLAQIEGESAVPVEYRKGRPRHLGRESEEDPGEEAPKAAAVEPWPTDRVQVGLQAILLEESGYRVPHAVIYYAAEKRRVQVAVDAELRADAMNVLHQAQECAAGKRPAPLVNDSRCVRCSLQPICLPDEVNQQTKEIKPRQIWPPRDEAMHLVAQQDGVHIGVNGMSLKVRDKEGGESKTIPLAGLESLAVVGNVQISTQALGALAEHKVAVAWMTSAGRLVAMMDPLDSVSAEIRRAQVHALDDPARCLELAKALIAAKIMNQRILLQRNGVTIPEMILEEMSRESACAKSAASLDEVRGHEGQGAALYFRHLAQALKTPLGEKFDENGRQRRPPPDPVNAVLSFGYTMLTHECVAALRQARLEPALGAFHVCRPGRPALALDLMEPFRPLVADSVMISLFNRGEVTEGHFTKTTGGWVLSDAGRRAFFGAWGRRMETEVTHPVFGYRLSYRRMLVLHARMIAAWMLGEAPTLAFLTTR